MADDWKIEMYAEEDGSEPVVEFLSSPDLTAGELKQLRTRLQYLRQSGLALIGMRADVLEVLASVDGIYSLRCPNTLNNPRILLCAVFERRFVLLHGFKEKNSSDYAPAIRIAEGRKARLEKLEKQKEAALQQGPPNKKNPTKKNKGKQ